MKRFTIHVLMIASIAVSTSAYAGTEAAKFINTLSVSSGGAIGITVASPGDSASSCTGGTMTLPSSGAERDRMFAMLQAAKTANVKVNVAFDGSCVITSVGIAQ